MRHWEALAISIICMIKGSHTRTGYLKLFTFGTLSGEHEYHDKKLTFTDTISFEINGRGRHMRAS